MSQIRDLLDQLAGQGATIAGVADDSRQVRPGDLFLAYPGDLADGRRFIADALARGAVAVCWQAGGDFVWSETWQVPHLQVDALRSLAGPIAHAVYAFPSERLSLIAITGTNGKTSISQFLSQVHPAKCAVIGTLGAGYFGAMEDTGFTTPEATTLMRYLDRFLSEGAQACALEASSIGIEEGRMNGARVDVAVFTNLTRDHLDYHGDMASYAEAKARLFAWPRLRTAIINLNDVFGQRLFRETSATRILGYAIGELDKNYPALVRAENLSETPFGQAFDLCLPTGRVAIETPLVGRYNISNLLAVAAVLLDAGMSAQQIALALNRLTPPPGRMERRGGNGQPLVVVDYCHTPDALENALRALSDVARGRGGKLSVVFGCGGDRDPGKRPLMGAIAETEADTYVITTDNPRSEPAMQIIEEIRLGLTQPALARVIPERAAAIAAVIAEAKPQDVVLLAGKGHETYQEVAGVRHHFSDIEEAERALARFQPGLTQEECA